MGWDSQFQRNTISGYSFLLPEYERFTTGVSWLTTYRPDNVLAVSGGIRYDYGRIHVFAHDDPYLATYLQEQGYSDEQVESYRWNSRRVNRSFGDYSLSLGVVWTPSVLHQLKVNVGRSFRLPGANELASNGVHHGTFRHEQGDATLSSEQGWQMDASYQLKYGRLFLRSSTGSAIISFCALRGNGPYYPIQDKFIDIHRRRHCLQERRQVQRFVFLLLSVIAYPVSMSIPIIVMNIFL